MKTQNELKVLLVDDNLAVSSGMKAVLERHEYTVITASNGKDALSILAEHDRFSLIILDYAMPVMNGKLFLKEIKKSKWNGIPILVVSGSDLEKLRNDALSLGAAEFFLKPVDIDVLLRAIKKHVDKKK